MNLSAHEQLPPTQPRVPQECLTYTLPLQAEIFRLQSLLATTAHNRNTRQGVRHAQFHALLERDQQSQALISQLRQQVQHLEDTVASLRRSSLNSQGTLQTDPIRR